MWEFVLCMCVGRDWLLNTYKHLCVIVCINICHCALINVFLLLYVFVHVWSRLCLIYCMYVCLICSLSTTHKGYWSCGRWCPDARGWSSGHQLTCRSHSRSWRRWSWRGRCGHWQTLAAGSLPPSGPSASTPAPCKDRKREKFNIPCNWLGEERSRYRQSIEFKLFYCIMN